MFSCLFVPWLLVLFWLVSISSAVFAGNDSVLLTLEQCFEYQRAIEQVYWNHRIWPKENQKPKPAPRSVMSDGNHCKGVVQHLRGDQMRDVGTSNAQSTDTIALKVKLRIQIELKESA